MLFDPVFWVAYLSRQRADLAVLHACGEVHVDLRRETLLELLLACAHGEQPRHDRAERGLDRGDTRHRRPRGVQADVDDFAWLEVTLRPKSDTCT